MPRLAELAKPWTILDGYYIPTRYPNGLPDSIPSKVYTQEAAREAVRLAEQAVNTMGMQIEELERGEKAKPAD